MQQSMISDQQWHTTLKVNMLPLDFHSTTNLSTKQKSTSLETRKEKIPMAVATQNSTFRISNLNVAFINHTYNLLICALNVSDT